MPDQNDGKRIPLPADEGPFFAGYAAHLASLDPADVEAEVDERRVDAQAAADANDPDGSRRVAVTLSIARDELERRSPGTSAETSPDLRNRHEAALADILQESDPPLDDPRG